MDSNKQDSSQDGLKVIRPDNQAGSQDPNELQDPKENIIKTLAEVGKTLHNTYSEENQNTAGGFIDALNTLKLLKSDLQLHNHIFLDQQTEAGLLDLLEYLEEKLQKRMRAVDENAYNM